MSASKNWKRGLPASPPERTKAKCQIVVVSVHFPTKRAGSARVKGACPGILSGTYLAGFVGSLLRSWFWRLHEVVQVQQEFDRGGFHLGRDRDRARDHRTAPRRRPQRQGNDHPSEDQVHH